MSVEVLGFFAGRLAASGRSVRRLGLRATERRRRGAFGQGLEQSNQPVEFLRFPQRRLAPGLSAGETR